MKQVAKILFCFISICIFLILCQKEEKESLSALNFQEEIELVENENNSEHGSSFLTFEEDLSIYKENWWPWQILVDVEGYIYVLADKRKTLIKCDVSAKFGQMRAFLKLQIICNNLKLGGMHDNREEVQEFA
jgi:acetone carboxylase gamma subunit